MQKEVKIIFEPSGRAVHALPGTTILEAAARAGFIIHTPCGGGGKCAKCLIRIRSGNCPPTSKESAILGEDRIAEGFRLSCQARISSPVTIEVPEADKRPVAATADHFEIRRVHRVEVETDRSKSLVLLHDPGHSLDERILREQFGY